MTRRETQLSPAERVQFTWNRAPEASWVPTDEMSEEQWEALDSCEPQVDSHYFHSGERGESYSPLASEGALFRDFASLDGSAGSLIEFARQYGPIIADWYTPLTLNVHEDSGFREWNGGVRRSLSEWQGEHRKLSDAVALFDALKSRTEPEAVAIARRYRDRDADQTPREEVQDALARLIVQMLHAGVALSRDGKVFGTGLRLTFSVRSLMDAMWLQLALAVDGDREYASCEVCGKWWDAMNAHPTKRTCGPRCRQILKRQKDAKKEGEVSR